jgi:hypothetical protein
MVPISIKAHVSLAIRHAELAKGKMHLTVLAATILDIYIKGIVWKSVQMVCSLSIAVVKSLYPVNLLVAHA